MKTIALSMFIFMSLTTWAQDNIIQKDGSEIKAKVVEITPEIIKYKRFDNINDSIYSLLKSKVYLIQYENGTRDLFKDPVVTDSIHPPLLAFDTTIIRNYIFINAAISAGFNQTTPRGLGAVTYTSIGYTGGFFYEMGNVIYFAPKKMPKNFGIGLNFTWLSIGITSAHPYVILFPYTGGFGPHFSFKFKKKVHIDIYAKPSISIVPIDDSFKPVFLMDIGLNFRYKAFTIGFSGAIIPVLYANYYDYGNTATAINIPHRYSHIKFRIGASIQNKY
jgi:hypothetical protein